MDVRLDCIELPGSWAAAVTEAATDLFAVDQRIQINSQRAPQSMELTRFLFINPPTAHNARAISLRLRRGHLL